jgi:hypothetical protein
MESKDNLIGFIWHKTPVMSQYLLKKQNNDSVSFEQWCKKSIEDFETNYKESLKQTQDDTEYLKNLGCSRVVVAPEPVGVIRCDLFEKFLADIPENTFVFVKSFAGFGIQSTLISCLKSALSRKIYVITEQHKSLTLLPIDAVSEVYENWVIKQNNYTRCRRNENESQKAINLINSGYTYTQAQEQMGVSRSTFYRLIAKRKDRFE